MFGISPNTLALRPSTVLQNIINEKQLAEQERQRATNERLALKRIAQAEAAQEEQSRQFGLRQEEQSRQFDVSQAGRGDMSDYQNWLKDNWGKMTPQQQAAEARKVAEENRKQEIYEREKTQAQGIDKFGQPTVQPTTQPAPQQVVTPTFTKPIQTEDEKWTAGVESWTQKQARLKFKEQYPNATMEIAQDKQESIAQPAQTIATSKTYTPPKDIVSVFEANQNLSQEFQILHERTQKLTPAKEMAIENRAKSEILAENPNAKNLRTLQRKAKVRAATYRRQEESNRKKAVLDKIKAENLIRKDIQAQTAPEKLKLSQKVTLAKTILSGSNSTGDKVLDARLKSAGLLTGDMEWTEQQRKWAQDILSSVTETNKDKYNKLRASGVSKEKAMRRLGL